MESPMNIDAPMTPSASNGQLFRPNARWPSAISESVPPSPLLSARSSTKTYFVVTTIKSAHRIRDRTPSTMIRVTAQKLVETVPSWVSDDVTLTAMLGENALWTDMIRAGYRRLPGKLVNRPTGNAGLPTKCQTVSGNIVVE